MAKNLTLRLGIAVLVLGLVAAACGDDDAGTTTTAAETTTTAATTTSEEPTTTAAGRADGILEIGTILPETGDLAVLGPPMIGAVNMALRDINDGGGVLGQPLVLIPADDGTNEDIANAAVDGHLAAGVDGIIGAASSRVSLAVIEGLAMILGAMEDTAGSQVVGWIALGVAVLLAVDLICLVLALAVNALADSDEPPDSSE